MHALRLCIHAAGVRALLVRAGRQVPLFRVSVPVSCVSNPAKSFNNELLPLPLGPMMATLSPALHTKTSHRLRLLKLAERACTRGRMAQSQWHCMHGMHDMHTQACQTYTTTRQSTRLLQGELQWPTAWRVCMRVHVCMRCMCEHSHN